MFFRFNIDNHITANPTCRGHNQWNETGDIGQHRNGANAHVSEFVLRNLNRYRLPATNNCGSGTCRDYAFRTLGRIDLVNSSVWMGGGRRGTFSRFS